MGIKQIIDNALNRNQPQPPQQVTDLGLSLYQKLAADFAVYPAETGKVYTALGVANEAGEYAGKIKKLMRQDGEADLKALVDELGDVLWYVAMAAKEWGIPLHVIAGRNIRKLNDRRARDQIKGDGDDR